MENPSFLKEKYNLHTTPEVESAAKRTEQRTGEKVPQKPEARIQNYLDRLERLVLDPEKKQSKSKISRWRPDRPRALSLLREMVMDQYVRPNKEKMAEGAARPVEKTETLDLVILSVSDLGLERGGTTNEVYGRALKLGLKLCPAWVGPQLRLSYIYQPSGDYIFIGMEQILDRRCRYPSVFYMGTQPRWWLVVCGRRSSRWQAESA